MDRAPNPSAAPTLAHRLARPADRAALTALMAAAIGELQAPFLSPAQIAASRAIMGLDGQLIDDGTYYVVEIGDALAGCGGWSRRATLYGGDRRAGREPRLLDPMRDAARIRAMYTAPAFVRQGVARLILARCEEAAAAEGFRRVELAATLAGEPLYRACGYEIIEQFEDLTAGVPVPLLRMIKLLP
jgi:GNAT superfamily N-acetyltransferase